MNLPTETKIFDPTTRKVAQMKLRYRRKQKCTLRYWKEDEMIPWWRMWWINNLLWLLKICLHYCLAIFPVFMKTDSHTQHTDRNTQAETNTPTHRTTRIDRDWNPHKQAHTHTHRHNHTQRRIPTTTHTHSQPKTHRHTVLSLA